MASVISKNFIDGILYKCFGNTPQITITTSKRVHINGGSGNDRSDHDRHVVEGIREWG